MAFRFFPTASFRTGLVLATALLVAAVKPQAGRAADLRSLKVLYIGDPESTRGQAYVDCLRSSVAEVSTDSLMFPNWNPACSSSSGCETIK